MARWFQYQEKAEGFAIALAVVSVTTLTCDVVFPRSIIYQSVAYVPVVEEVPPPPVVQVAIPTSVGVGVPVRRQWQYQIKTEPVLVPDATDTVVAPSTGSVTVKFNRRWQYQTKAEPVVIPAAEVVTVDKWFEPLSELTRRKSFIKQHQITSDPIVVPAAPVDPGNATWYQPLSEPRFAKSKAAFQEDLSWSTTTPSVAVEPTIITSSVIFSRSIIYEDLSWAPPTIITAETITEDKWHQPWSEPVRTRRFSTAEQQTLAWGIAAPQPEVITEDKWHQPWSDPVRTRKLATAQQQFLAWSGFTPEVITEDKWHRPWLDPVRVRPKVVFQQDSAWAAPTIITAEVVTEDKWYQPWAEPRFVKSKTAFQEDLFWSATTATAVEPTIITSQVVFPRSIIYEDLSWAPPTPTAAEVVTQDKWYRPLSEPVRIRQLAVAQRQDLIWSTHTPTFVPPVLPEYWTLIAGDTGLTFQKTITYQISAEAILADVLQPYLDQPWSQPVRVNLRLGARYNPALAWSGYAPPIIPPITAIANLTLTSQVVFKRSIIYQSRAWTPITIAPPPAAVYYPLVEGDTGLTFRKWFIYQVNTQPIHFETSFEPFWFAPLSEPVRRRPSTVYQRAFFAPEARVVAAPKAIEPATVSSQVIFPRSIIYEPHTWTPITIAPSAFQYVPVSQGDTGLLFQKTIIYQVSAEAAFDSVTEREYWYQPLSEPVRKKRGLATNEHQTLAWSGHTPPFVPPVTAKSTATASSQVVFQRSIIYQSLAWTPKIIIPETIREDKWHQPWSEPVRVRPKVVFQKDLAWTPIPIAPPTHVDYGSYVEGDTGLTFQKTIIYQVSAEAETLALNPHWYCPWSEPVRQKRGLATNRQQELAWSTITPAPVPDIVSEDKWHQAWSEPVRTRKLATAQQPFLAWSTHTPPVDASNTVIVPITSTSQVTFRRRTIYQPLAWAAPTIVAPEVITEDKWYQAWSEPIRTRRLATAQNPFLVWSRFTPPVTEDEWHQAWSEPVRTRKLPTAEQQALIWTVWVPVTPETITEDKWHQGWSIPVKLRYQFRTDLQQPVAEPPVYPNLLRTIPWYAPWSEPVRLKKGTQARLQESFGKPPSYPILLRIIPWYGPLAEPVRQKKGLWARLQQFFTVDAHPPPQPPVFVTLDATETNNDVASVFALVYNPAVRCYVSIKEVPGSDPTYASIEETD
jgi:hypothetical protein